ncbi:sulfatase-like hydrolase/transferase [Lentisphaera marina]|uniref:sulfatase-like hydrolase/transferase n=1 Tax=Lentisphaera marina TaxID=1111041 RepID=UPI002366C289|nr:sulfatase-like hydrolase/transferase [Lentisphaera marina]MDD7985555.1 sulfatase-like hydrolase/transferase [Lentisphaera marina]
MKYLLLLLLSCTLAAEVQKPNLIVIMADDLGYADVGFNGSKHIATPHLDALAASGVVCTNAYTTYSVCGPSRAGFMVGRYQQRFGFERNPKYDVNDPLAGVPLDEMTIAESLSQVGYKCGVIGKWHLGAHEQFHPLRRGFDEFYGHLGGGHKYFPSDIGNKTDLEAKSEPESYVTLINRNYQQEKTEKYLTHEFSDEAIQFVEKNKSEPFFLFLSYNAPHGPLQAPQEYIDRFKQIKNIKRRTYAAMVSAMDDGVGRLMHKIEELNLKEKTLIFFLSDNGGPENKNFSYNGDLRGAKSSPYEGGFRVPFLVSLPGSLPSGVKYPEAVSSLDIFATINALSQSPTKNKLDGVNLLPYLNKTNAKAPHKSIYLRKFDQGAYVIRQGDFKLVIPGRGKEMELYNLENDISEKHDIAQKHPETVQYLKKALDQWDSELIDPVFKGLKVHK